MPSTKPVLHMMCGKIASGKSTLAAELGSAPATIVIAEDEWLNALYEDDITSMRAYMRCMQRLRSIIGPHIVSLLKEGVSVVLDFQANTVEARQWMKQLLEQTDADHKLHVLDVPDDICLARLRDRNAQGDHPFSATEEQFRQISKHFVLPTEEEGFEVVVHPAPAAK